MLRVGSPHLRARGGHAHPGKDVLEHHALEFAVVDANGPHALRKLRVVQDRLVIEHRLIVPRVRLAAQLEDSALGLEGDGATALQALRAPLHDPRAVALGRDDGWVVGMETRAFLEDGRRLEASQLRMPVAWLIDHAQDEPFLMQLDLRRYETIALAVLDRVRDGVAVNVPE